MTQTKRIATTKAADQNVYQLKITLQDIRPPIWRRVLVPATTDLGTLHTVLQEAMGWYDSHLHEFRVGGETYGDPMPDADWHPDHNEHRTQLSKVLTTLKTHMIYLYDFGDGWEHRIELEAVLHLEKGKLYPVCLTGKRNCPPEDCGGPWGYQNMLDILKDAKHEEYESTVTWLGGHYEPEHFDLKRINHQLALL
jgi:hypothetical protein